MPNWLQKLIDALLKKRKPPLPPVDPPPSGSLPERMLALHNRERHLQGLKPLSLDAVLTRVAQEQSQFQADSNLLTHDGPGGSQLWERVTAAGYSWSRIAENIAPGHHSPEPVVEVWMRSPGHRSNILGAYVHAGFGRAISTRGVSYWTAVYATPGGRRESARLSPLSVSAGALAVEHRFDAPKGDG